MVLRNKLGKSALAGLALCALVACDGESNVVVKGSGADTGENTDGTATANIVDTAVAAGSFTTLVAALQATGLDAALADSSQTYTVFAPTDDAFAKLGDATITALLADTDALSDILLYHVLAGNAVDAQTAISLAGTSVPAANDDLLNISLRGTELFINDSQVTATDINATNGVIHVIDTVLLPPADNDTSGGGGSGDDDAGNDDSGNDDSGNNDSGAGGNSGSSGGTSIVDTAVSAGRFNTLAAALQATGLDSVLADESATFTVFAPNDEAFNKLGSDTINALLADPDALKNILLYHVIGGTAVNAETAIGLAGTKITAANNAEFALSLNDGSLFVNTSKVIATDIMASNGVIHEIDTVLLPPSIVETHGSVVDLALADGRFTTLIAALQATHLDTVLADHSGIFTVFAPTDDAFAALGQDTINALLGDTDTLSNILLTHVVAGATVDSVTAFSLSGGNVDTASGNSITLAIRDGSLFVNNAKVIQTDIKAENGIIHVIDAVIQ